MIFPAAVAPVWEEWIENRLTWVQVSLHIFVEQLLYASSEQDRWLPGLEAGNKFFNTLPFVCIGKEKYIVIWNHITRGHHLIGGGGGRKEKGSLKKKCLQNECLKRVELSQIKQHVKVASATLSSQSPWDFFHLKHVRLCLNFLISWPWVYRHLSASDDSQEQAKKNTVSGLCYY